MKHHPIETTAVGSVVLVRLVRAVLVPVIALVLTVAGWQPSQTSQPQPLSMPAASLPDLNSQTVARDWAGRPLDCLTVRELRLQARAGGHRALARSGRRADLLAVLAG